MEGFLYVSFNNWETAQLGDAKNNIDIWFSVYDECLSVKVKIGNQIQYHEEKLRKDVAEFSNYLLWWILSKLKPVFWAMPIRSIRLKNSQEVIDTCGAVIQRCVNILGSTNNALEKHKSLKGVCNTFDGILIFNVEEHNPYRQLHKSVALEADRVFYQNMKTGFNRMIRQWEHAPVPFAVGDLADYLIENKIKKVVVINNYLLEKYLFQENVYLLSLMRYMGVEIVNIEQDHAELRWHGYLLKDVFFDRNNMRFAHGLYQEYWDEFYGNKKDTTYTSALIFDLEETPDIKLDADYKLVMISNSRIREAKAILTIYLYLMDRLNPERVFTDFSLWYL
ncbi:MAG TPA: hypothetical protein DHV36_23510, partial [Desulfobacteraceae bacterium]|nr:hypothetical protein [Desulfobacteraceae bacterium]